MRAVRSAGLGDVWAALPGRHATSLPVFHVNRQAPEVGEYEPRYLTVKLLVRVYVLPLGLVCFACTVHLPAASFTDAEVQRVHCL